MARELHRERGQPPPAPVPAGERSAVSLNREREPAAYPITAQMPSARTAPAADGSQRAVVRWRYDWGGGHVRGVDGDAFTAPFSAPSARPPSWQMYRFRFHAVVGMGHQ